MKTLAMLTALGLTSAAAIAVAAPHGDGMERLKAADTNGDGLISKAEAQAALPRLYKHFDEVDTNHDGQISKDELRAAHQAMRGKMFDKMDANHDGVISRDEFNAFQGGHHHGSKQGA
jgi:Ca2+-binding EF-hand superfamily protein